MASTPSSTRSAWLALRSRLTRRWTTIDVVRLAGSAYLRTMRDDISRCGGDDEISTDTDPSNADYSHSNEKPRNLHAFNGRNGRALLGGVNRRAKPSSLLPISPAQVKTDIEARPITRARYWLGITPLPKLGLRVHYVMHYVSSCPSDDIQWTIPVAFVGSCVFVFPVCSRANRELDTRLDPRAFCDTSKYTPIHDNTIGYFKIHTIT